MIELIILSVTDSIPNDTGAMMQLVFLPVSKRARADSE